MDELEKSIRITLSDAGKFDAGKAESLRKEILQMFDKNLQKAKLIFWISFLLSLGMMGGGYIGLRLAADTREMLSWVIFFMIGFNSTILIKLWYWVADTKLNVLKEMKHLQLQITELTGKISSAES
jgi:hypothetical protein